MLTQKQFCERAKTELRQIGEQLRGMAADRNVYCRFESEIVQRNPQLKESRSAFLDMVRGCYVDAMIARLLRLLEPAEGDVSLPRVLEQLAGYPELLHDKITQQEFAKEREALQRAGSDVRRVALPRTAHHELTLSALASAQREIDIGLDLMLSTVKTYYWVVANSYIELHAEHPDDPMSVFTFTWATPTAAR